MSDMEFNAWPDLNELKRLLDVDSADYDDHLERLLEAAISQVKRDVGHWDDDADVPTSALVNAALRAASLMRPNADSVEQPIHADPVYQFHMKGHHRRFHIG